MEILLPLVFGIGLVLLLRRNTSSGSGQESETDSGLFQFQPWDSEIFQFRETEPVDVITDNLTDDRKIRAFLHAIMVAEGTTKAFDPYTVLYGYDTSFPADYDEHPALQGWPGVPLPDAYCKSAGFAPGCVSTAAGAYQIIRPTWVRLKARLNLPDFGPGSQDAAAIELLRESGALQSLLDGDVAGAINLASRTWASLPGAGYGQPEQKLAAIVATYESALS